MSAIVTFLGVLTGAQFAPKWGAQFAPKCTAHFKPKYYAQFDRNLQLYINTMIKFILQKTHRHQLEQGFKK